MEDRRPASSLVELAPAKVNLALHVTGKRPDGYHLLDSLVAFPQVGDRLSVAKADRPEFVLEGPFGPDLSGDADDNLVLRTVKAFEAAAKTDLPALKITLTKRLPIASGVGGGSSDAAATLRLLEDFTGIYLPDETLHRLALSLGADVPVCLIPEARRMQGIGGDLENVPRLPDCGIVLINPRVEVPTPSVFKALANPNNSGLPSMPESFPDASALVAYLANCRNDLQDPAIRICEEIGHVLSALEADGRVQLARMSGSGATCFGLCNRGEALEVERNVRSAHPQWWVASGPLQ